MAGAGYKLFNTGDVLTAQQVNEYLMQQTVMSFADAAARTTALSGVLAEGMVSYLRDTNVVEIYTGASWVSLDDPNAIQNSIVDAKGDLISATADNTPARLASSGVNGHVLKINTSTSTGLEWGAAGGGQLTETVFTSSNASWTIPTGVTQIWALVVGGGGGAGATSTATAINSAGGGGAGQVKEQLFTVSGDTTLNITVGAGGAGATTQGAKGSSGSASTIVGNTSSTTYVTSAGGGGGGGGAAANISGIAGASSGGTGSTAASQGGGGGGFTGSASSTQYGVQRGSSYSMGNGTVPTTFGVTGCAGGTNPQAEYYGGSGIVIWNRALAGGGHGQNNNGTNTIATNFGAAVGSAVNTAGGNATANTGAGGGAPGTNSTTQYNGGNGGSGLVVLRYVA